MSSTVTLPVPPQMIPELVDPTQACIGAIETLADSFGADSYIGAGKLLNPLLLTAWSEQLPTGPKDLLERFIASLSHRDLATPGELRTLATTIAAAA